MVYVLKSTLVLVLAPCAVTFPVTLFGDLALNTAVQVELIDDRNPSKNGVYIVDEVVTKFGTEGYRQTISIPYRIKGNKTEEDK